jgi:hypothetical protein
LFDSTLNKTVPLQRFNKSNLFYILNFKKMKKLVLFAAAVMAIAFASCTPKTTEEAPVAPETVEVAPAIDAVIDTTVAAVDSTAAVVDSTIVAQ